MVDGPTSDGRRLVSDMFGVYRVPMTDHERAQVADIADDPSWPERMTDEDAPRCPVIDMAEYQRRKFDAAGEADTTSIGPIPFHE